MDFDYGPEGKTLGGAGMRDCRPDYENMISRATEQRGKAQSLLDALYVYMGEMRPKGTTAEMVGELVCEVRRLDASVDQLISQQESDDRPER